MSRVIIFKMDDTNRVEFNFGIYCVMMYYATQVNPVRAKKLFDAGISEWSFRDEYGLDLGNLTNDDLEAHYVYADIQDIVPFINNEVIPALDAETEEEILDVTYGGADNFMDLYYSSEDYLGIFGVIDSELYADVYGLREEFKVLRDFFQVIIEKNKIYEVWIE